MDKPESPILCLHDALVLCFTWRITRSLFRLCGCAVWTVQLSFACAKTCFPMTWLYCHAEMRTVRSYVMKMGGALWCVRIYPKYGNHDGKIPNWVAAELRYKACLDGMILSAWQNHTWFCHVWFLCLDGITKSCVISFNSGETGLAPWAISSCSTSFHCYS